MSIKCRKVLAIVFISVILAVSPLLTEPCAPAYAEESESECWAVIIGISDYSELEEAPGCATGAKELHQQLRPTWGDEHIKLLLDSQATKTGIREAISWLVSNEDTNDTVLFYFTGHSEKGCMSTYNAYYPDTAISNHNTCYADTWISAYELSSWLRLDSERVAIILDSCYAARFNSKLIDSGRAILASSSANERACCKGTRNVFTYYLTKAFNEFGIADLNGDYELSAEELFQYAETETISETEDFGEEQHPVLSDDYSGELSLLMKCIFSTEPDLPAGPDILTVDDKAYSSFPFELTWAPGSVHDLGILPLLDTGNGTRYIFTSWNDGDDSDSRIISDGGAYTANYLTQYQLLIKSEYGEPEGQGWYDEDSTATISAPPIEGMIVRHAFTGWSGDFAGATPTATLTVNSPMAVTANWRTDYTQLYILIAGLIVLVAIPIVIRRRRSR